MRRRVIAWDGRLYVPKETYHRTVFPASVRRCAAVRTAAIGMTAPTPLGSAYAGAKPALCSGGAGQCGFGRHHNGRADYDSACIRTDTSFSSQAIARRRAMAFFDRYAISRVPGAAGGGGWNGEGDARQICRQFAAGRFLRISHRKTAQASTWLTIPAIQRPVQWNRETHSGPR